jgi:hypothetical protein
MLYFQVTEKVQGTTVKDDDYIRIGRPMTFTWKNKFLEAAATIEKYRLYMSTFPGGKYKLFRRVYVV